MSLSGSVQIDDFRLKNTVPSAFLNERDDHEITWINVVHGDREARPGMRKGRISGAPQIPDRLPDMGGIRNL